ncbi:hypothetical protein [Bacillus sp. 7884-1]|uniref:hypothetical protein n=1 Tax=Bacillus sp. 7884-1 TaxID=2021693 RepID=UPI000BA7244A|nr:hypothetical protein [Bacillus sp. 7884-1]PAE36315.1 hypothetical protein CHI06_22935 [Bacillus sp. 7884-1]
MLDISKTAVIKKVIINETKERKKFKFRKMAWMIFYFTRPFGSYFSCIDSGRDVIIFAIY